MRPRTKKLITYRYSDRRKGVHVAAALKIPGASYRASHLWKPFCLSFRTRARVRKTWVQSSHLASNQTVALTCQRYKPSYTPPNLSSGKKGESCYLLLEAVSYLQTKRNSIRRIPCRENMSRLYRYSMIFQSLGTYRPSDFAEILWMSFFLTLQQAKNFRRFAFLFLKLFLSSLCCVVICSIESPSRLRDNFRCFSKRPRFSSPKKTSFSPINLCSNFEGQPATNVAHRGKRFARFDSGE